MKHLALIIFASYSTGLFGMQLGQLADSNTASSSASSTNKTENDAIVAVMLSMILDKEIDKGTLTIAHVEAAEKVAQETGVELRDFVKKHIATIFRGADAFRLDREYSFCAFENAWAGLTLLINSGFDDDRSIFVLVRPSDLRWEIEQGFGKKLLRHAHAIIANNTDKEYLPAMVTLFSRFTEEKYHHYANLLNDLAPQAKQSERQ